MQVVVETPTQRVRVSLDAAVAAPMVGADLLLRVHPQIAVGVFHQPEVWRFVDEDAVVERLHGTPLHEPIGKDSALVHLAVVIRVFQHADPAHRLQVRFRVGEIAHVFRILDHPEAAVRIPVDRNRILNEGFGGHELHPVAGRQVEMLDLVRGRERWGCLRRLLHARRP